MSDRSILIIDDEKGMSSLLADLFGELGYEVKTASDGKEGLAAALAGDFDLVISDLSMPGLDGMGVLKGLKEKKPDTPVIMMTAYATMKSAIEAVKLGSYDYITKPFDLTEVQIIAERALERRRLIDENRYLKDQIKQNHGLDNVIGSSPLIQQAYVLATKVADSSASVLILGETGTGKEYMAKAVHYQSPRADKPFIKVSCSALPETLLESELFGHEKGAFTNAIARRIGRFEMAHKGTIFLDELGDMSHATQLKLLRVLQEKEFERVGGSETVKVDVRVIAATNKDLGKAIEDKEFREDLYYRLNVISIHLPSLRQRAEDIPELARHFLRKYCAETGKKIEDFEDECIPMLMEYGWPGNIRELENCIERAVILCNGSTIRPQHLLLSGSAPAAITSAVPLSGDGMEKKYIVNVLKYCEGDRRQAASVLGLEPDALAEKIKFYELGTEIAGNVSEHAEKK